MKKYFIILFLFLSQFVVAQKIINAVMVGDRGITEDAKIAKYLIVVKSYGDTAFERLEYNFTGPMKRRLTYKDPQLKLLNGNYADFSTSGFIASEGNYLDNKKEGDWYLYNDTAKAITKYKYHRDTLLSVTDVDSLEKEKKKYIKVDTADEHEAFYKGGEKKYTTYIYQHLTIPERTKSLEKGGTVKVRFIIDKEGKVTNVQIRKSVEFAFDEEVMRVIASAKDWVPASQKGKKLNAYREQPITISFK